MSLTAQSIPLSLYIHLPWCVEKCPYCDFNSHKMPDDFSDKLIKEKQEHKYISSLFTDLENDLPSIWGRTVETIFIGGGTPSLFSGEAIEQLISGVRARLMLRADLEITLESNPGTADAINYLGYRQAGVNRLSLGVQSFDNTQLKKLGRIHNAQQAIDAFHLARKAGFERINIDLMFALPDQSIADALADLDQAIKLDPEHISWYQLTIEPNTIFNRYPPEKLPDDDGIWEIQQAGFEKLKQAGYNQYEISAWSKNGEQCQHNINYWQFGDYLGIGAGAHGKITDFSENTIKRTRRRKQPNHWLNNNLASTNDYLASSDIITDEDLALEFMMNALRLNEGVAASLFTERTGLPITNIFNAVQDAQAKELLENRFDVIRPTSRGLNYLNDLLALFMNLKTQNNRHDPQTAISFKEIK